MALTFTSQQTQGDPTAVNSLISTLLGGGTGLYVASYMDASGHCRSFMPSVMGQETAADNATKWFPQVNAATAVLSSSGTAHDGPIKLVLTAETADVVNGSSPLTVYLDRFANITTVTGTFA